MKTSNMRLTVTFSMIGLFCSTACVKEIPADDIFVTPVPVINSLFKNGDELHIQITKSRSIIHDDNQDEFIFPSDAEITVYENNIELQPDITFDNNLYTLTSLNLDPDSIYRIEVKLPDYNLVTAESTIPVPANIDSIQIRRVYTTDAETNEITNDLLRGNIFFYDNPGENFYMIQLESFTYILGNENYDRKNDFYRSSDPIAVDANYHPEEIRALVFNDNLFNGEICDLDFEIRDGIYPEGYKDSTLLLCKLYSLSDDFYKYMITYSGQYTSDFSLMSEPINLYTNIENGLGIFAGYSIDTLSIGIK